MTNAQLGITEGNSIRCRAPEQRRLLRLPDVCCRTGLRRSMIYKMEADHKFPKRIKIGLRAVGWIEEEIVQWIEARIASSRVGPRES